MNFLAEYLEKFSIEFIKRGMHRRIPVGFFRKISEGILEESWSNSTEIPWRTSWINHWRSCQSRRCQWRHFILWMDEKFQKKNKLGEIFVVSIFLKNLGVRISKEIVITSQLGKILLLCLIVYLHLLRAFSANDQTVKKELLQKPKGILWAIFDRIIG